MAEVLKILIKIFLQVFRGFGARLSASKLLRPRTGVEKYLSNMSEFSRTQPKDPQAPCCHAFRVPFQSTLQFSVLFPGTLNGFEREYFMGKRWVKYFEDTRNASSVPKELGFFIPWNDQAFGTAGIFPLVWQLSKKLPHELREVHGDGTHVRFLFHGTSAQLDRLRLESFRPNFLEFVEGLAKLPIEEKLRINLLERFPFLIWLLGGFVIVLFALLIGALIPRVNILDSGQQLLFPIVLGGILLLGLFIRFRSRGTKAALQLSCICAMFGAMLSYATVLRVNVMLYPDGHLEEWRVTGMTPLKKKYTREPDGLRLLMSGPSGAYDELRISESRLQGLRFLDGDRVEATVHSGFLGFAWATSMKIHCRDGRGTSVVEELVQTRQ